MSKHTSIKEKISFLENITFSNYYNTDIDKLPFFTIYKEIKARVDFIAFLLKDKNFFIHHKDKNNLLKNDFFCTEKKEYSYFITYYYYSHNHNHNHNTFDNNVSRYYIDFKKFLLNFEKNNKDLEFIFSCFDFDHLPKHFFEDFLFDERNNLYKLFFNNKFNKYNYSIDVVEQLSLSSIKENIYFNLKSKIIYNYLLSFMKEKKVIKSYHKKLFRNYIYNFIGDFLYPEDIEILFFYFFKQNFYTDRQNFDFFTNNFSQKFWTKYNDYHHFNPLKLKLDFSLDSHKFIVNLSSPEYSHIYEQIVEFSMTIAYNYSIDFYSKNSKKLLSIYKGILSNINNKSNKQYLNAFLQENIFKILINLSKKYNTPSDYLLIKSFFQFSENFFHNNQYKNSKYYSEFQSQILINHNDENQKFFFNLKFKSFYKKEDIFYIGEIFLSDFKTLILKKQIKAWQIFHYIDDLFKEFKSKEEKNLSDELFLFTLISYMQFPCYNYKKDMLHFIKYTNKINIYKLLDKIKIPEEFQQEIYFKIQQLYLFTEINTIEEKQNKKRL